MNEPTNCARCNCELNSCRAGWVNTHDKDGNVIRVICSPCYDQEGYQAYAKTGVITSRTLMSANLNAYDIEKGTHNYFWKEDDAPIILQINAAYKNLRLKVKDFEQRVWFSGLQKIVRATTTRGVSASYNGLSVLTWCMAGRCMFTIEKDKQEFSFITDETSTESCMGIQGMNATEGGAYAMLDEAIKEYEAGNLKFVPDGEVSIAI